jgi:predicted AlkP superfamily phosphohydrolase/phosphomutase
MKRLKLPSLLVTTALVCLLLVALGCSLAGRREHAERLVLISYDGTSADLAWSWIKNEIATDPDGLAAMADQGFAARRVRPVSPTLTAVNHASLITAGTPAETGIVSNRFRPAGSPINHEVLGFNEGLEKRSLWQAAHDQGKRVGVICWAAGAVDGVYPDSDLGVSWPENRLARSALLELDPEQAGTTGEIPSQDGLQPLLWTLTIALDQAQPESLAALVAAFDANPDGKPRYDSVAVRMPDASSWSYLEERQWFPVDGRVRAADDQQAHRYGSWCKILRIDRHRGNLSLLQGAVYRLHGYPDSFVEEMSEQVGFWPGPPDGYMLSDWWLDASLGIDLDTYIEQVVRLDRYLDQLTLQMLDSYQADLVVAYHPGPDEYQHASLIVQPQQWAYSPGCALAAREGLKQVGESVDQSVGDIWRALDPARDALVVLSDHGLLPLHDVVHINQVLADAGLVKVDSSGERPRIADDTPLKAVSSGSCAHIYLNLQGREPEGVVAPEQATDLLRRAARALADIEGDNGPVVEQTLIRPQAAAIGLDHDNSGDLIVFMQPGYSVAPWLAEKHIEPTKYYAQHGNLNHHDELCAMLFARGAGVRRSRPKEVHATSVAHLIASWFGITFQ